MKVQLEVKPLTGWAKKNFGHTHIKAAPPFFIGGSGVYLHRVRSAIIHSVAGKYTHTSVRFWCGAQSFIDSTTRKRTGKFYSEPPEGGVVCATCEGRAVGAGLLGAKEINGMPVNFSPRRKSE